MCLGHDPAVMGLTAPSICPATGGAPAAPGLDPARRACHDEGMVQFRIKRVYEPAAPDDGVRVLVDRLWPRGVSRDRAALDLWPKEVAPSTALRERWHGDPRGHEPARFAAFEEAYREELAEDPARSALAELARAVAGKPRVLLLTATKDPSVSHVPVIRAALAEALAKL